MARLVAHKGAEYAHFTVTDFQEFQLATRPEASKRRVDMDKLWDDLNNM